MKIPFILSKQVYTSFTQPWILDIVQDYIDIKFIEDNPSIDKKSIYVTNSLDSDSWVNFDHKVIVDNLWENYEDNGRPGFVLYNKNWFWYNESLWYRYLNYHHYQRDYNFNRNGLLLMNLKKTHRDLLYNKLDLSKLMYSYVGNNIFIDYDIDINKNEWQRYFNPIWYNSTLFSIVAESTVSDHEPLFVTEKTFKPMAFSHPFIVFGQSGVLAYLKSQGFETFENIFDESYDNILNVSDRLLKIVDEVNHFAVRDFDLITLEKLQHNKELFYDQQFVKTRIIKEIINPIIEYAET